MVFENLVAISPRGNRVVCLVDGKVIETVLADDEVLVPLDNYNDFFKPIRVDGAWAEGAAQEELDTVQLPPQAPTALDLLQAENTELKLALAELAEAYEVDKTEIQLAIAELADLYTGGE